MSNKITNDLAFFAPESVFGAQADECFMRLALQQAQKAAAREEVPVGAIVVDVHGVIIARGYNKVEQTQSQTAHAEMHALLKASRKKNNWRLEGCWIYVTLEPCVMCIGLIVNSRMAGIVYGARSFLFGYSLDKDIASWVYKKNAFRIVQGVGAQQSGALLKDFFTKKRESQ